MTYLTKLGFLFLFFVLAGVTTAPGYSVLYEIPTPLFVVNLEGPTSREQAAVAAHLADKYAQPEGAIMHIVKVAYREGLRVGVSPLTLLAIMEKESGLRAKVVNGYGAVGLMQVVPRFHLEKLKKGDVVAQLQHPDTNIRVGSQVLAEYLRSSKGNLTKALVRYSGNASQYAERVAKFKGQLEKVLAARTANSDTATS